jgi:threonine dehydrogenase-like Zn-dependent dehydrogenase
LLAGDIYAPCKIRLVDVPEQTLDGPPEESAVAGGYSAGMAAAAGGDIIFQPELACLCGSDLLYFERDYPEFPVKIGHSLHEMTGTVIDTNGTRFKRGDRVLCVPVEQRGLYERYRVSEERAIPLDPRRPEEQALLAQPLGTVIYALKKIPHLIDLDVVVVGQGPIGQLFNLALRNVGARQIIGIDLLESRLRSSPRCGATATIDASREDAVQAVSRMTGGRLADLVIEAVGHREQTLNMCADLCRRDGRILFFGVPPERIDGVRWMEVFRKNITVHTSVNPDFARDFPLAMRWISEGRIDVSPVITHHFPLREIQTAFETFRERRDGALKVFVEFPSRKK